MSLEKKTDKIIRDKLKQHASPLPAHLWEGVDAVLESDRRNEIGGTKVIRDKLKSYASPLPTHLWEGVDAVLEGDRRNEMGGTKAIRNKLKDHASPLPTHLWEGVDTALEEDRRKRRRGAIWWWTSGAALLLALMVAGYFLFTESDKNSTTNNTVTKGIATTAPTINQNQEQSNATLNNTSYTDQLIEAKDQNNRESNNPTTAASEVASEKIVSEKSTQVATPKNQSTVTKSFNSTNVVTNSTGLITPTVGTTNEALPPTQEGAEKPSIFDAEVPGVKVFEKMAMPVGLQMDSKDALLEDRSLEELDWPSFINKDPECARFGKWLRLYFYADAYFSPDIAFRTLKPKTADYYEYSQTREDTESRGISFSSGLRFSVVSNYGWALRTGIVYSQINEKFDYLSEDEVRTTIKTIYGPGNVVIGYDTLVENGSRFKTTYNHYKMIDIPLIVGYEVNAKNKMSFSLNGGVYLNIMSRQKGDFLSPENKLVSFTSEEENPYPAFKSRLNLSLFGSVGVMYNITDQWQLLLEPQVRYYMDPLTNRNYMVEQSYFSTGLITGLRYKF